MVLGSISSPQLRLAVVGGIFALGFAAGALMTTPPAATMAQEAQPGFAVRPEQTNFSRPIIKGSYAAEVLRVLDGDTFEARVQLWPGLDVTTRVRLRGIDAPELKAHCAEERIKAEAVRDVLKAMLAEGDVAVMRVSLDKYGGRVVADASARNTPDVSGALLAQGLVRSYGGGRRETWCGAAG